MRKLIDIDDKLIPELARIAAIDKKRPKNWIEDLIAKELRKRMNEHRKD